MLGGAGLCGVACLSAPALVPRCLGLAAREGDAAPGTGPRVNFGSLGRPVLNAAGQTAFWGSLTGLGVHSFNDHGLWATDPNGVLTLIVRTGDLFDVSDEPLTPDYRTVTVVSILFESTGDEDGTHSPFNGAGQLAFFATFTDGSSRVFVATIPEPATLAILGTVLLAVPRRGSGAGTR